MNIKEKELRRQRARGKRGLYERNRKKKFQRLKHTGQFDQYSQQKAGIQKTHKTIKSSQGSGIPQLSRWKKFINFIKRFFKKTK